VAPRQTTLFPKGAWHGLTERSLGYSPQYAGGPFTDFSSITPETDITQLNLNWREADLPERERTKHVHRLHPYLGKFIPQLVEIFLRKYRPEVVCDPFCGSGTVLVEAKALGIDAVGCDISAFNCLLTRVKTDAYDIRKLRGEIGDILVRFNYAARRDADHLLTICESDYLRKWFHPRALTQLLCFRSLIGDYEYQDLLRVILSRAARSARLTTHFDLDFPKKPVAQPYHCHKHGRVCQPTKDASQFLNRYAIDALKRVAEFSRIARPARTTVLHADARSADFPFVDLVVTSPPYVGLIDYHEQHRYAYELLNLPQNPAAEIGPAFRGTSKSAQRRYVKEIGEVLCNLSARLSPGGRFVIIVSDKHGLYEGLAEKRGFEIETRLTRHVNRRTGRRANDFFEEVLIWRRA